MVSFRGQKKLGPRPDRSPLGVYFKISDKHPYPFHMRSLPPRGGIWRPSKWRLPLNVSTESFLLILCLVKRSVTATR